MKHRNEPPIYTFPLSTSMLKRFGVTIVFNTLLGIAEDVSGKYRVRVALGEPRDNNERALGAGLLAVLEKTSVAPKRKKTGRRARPKTARNRNRR